MELTQIRYFLEVARSQHVTKSAEKLHVAQPSLTQAIHRLEHELGVPLFVSKGRNIVLTEYGRYLLEKLEPLIEKLDDIPRQLSVMAELETATIHLNVLAASLLVSEAIIAYKRLHRDVHFQLLQQGESDLYDIGVTTHLFYQQPDSAQDRFVLTEKIYLAVPNTDRFRDMRSVRLADMRNESFICLYSRQMRWICDKFCQHAGFQPHIAFESDAPSAVRNMIGASMGVGFWPEISWGRLDSEHVRLLEIEDVVCQRDILFTRKYNKTDNSVVDDFFAFLRSYAGAQFTGGD